MYTFSINVKSNRIDHHLSVIVTSICHAIYSYDPHADQFGT